MSRRVSRPQADKKKIHCRNEFELCYLRHQYLRRAKKNPNNKEMEPFQKITTLFAQKTYFTYRRLFFLVGLEREDIVNIANVHLVSFLGLFSLENMPEKYEEFIQYFENIQNRKPKESDILDKNKANFTLFLKQRMEDVVRVCRQKARNIKGLPADGFFYYCGPNKPPKNPQDLIKNYESLGFRKLDTSVFKSIKKKVDSTTDLVFTFDGNYYIAVPLEKNTLRLHDFSGAGINPYDSLHNMTPEEAYFTLEDEDMWESHQEEFDASSPDDKKIIIENFIEEKKKDPKYREEIRTARRLLKEL